MFTKLATFFFVLLAFVIISWSTLPSTPSSKNKLPFIGRTDTDEDEEKLKDNKFYDLEKTIQKSRASVEVPSSSTSAFTSSSSSSLLRYEIDHENFANSDAEKLRESCKIEDLERAAFYNKKRKSSSSSSSNSDKSTANDAIFPAVASDNNWLFRNWCHKYTKLSSPFPEKNQNNNIKKKKKDESNNNNDPLPFRLDSDQLRALFQDQVTLFVGDSVVRNHFVLTMARMCNEKNRGKCMTRLPTYEYDIVRPDPATRGPLGCIPENSEKPPTNGKQSRSAQALGSGGSSSKKNKKKPSSEEKSEDESEEEKEDEQESSTSNKKKEKKPTKTSKPTTKEASSSNSKAQTSEDISSAAEAARKNAEEASLTDCYKNGSFQFVPAPGLTASREPKRTERKAFMRKGVITPLIRMEVDRAVFYYIPVNTPKQIAKFAKWLALKAFRSAAGSEIAKARTVFVSTGPHLSQQEMNSSIHLLKPALSFIQRVLRSDSSIILAETTHLLNGPSWYAEFVDGVMDRWREELASLSEQTKNNNNNTSSSSSSSSSSSTASATATVDLVPQRFVTIGGFFSPNPKAKSVTVSEKGGQETLRRQRRTCQYYDAQHPAESCQEVLTELLLMAAYTSRAKKLTMTTNTASVTDELMSKNNQKDKKRVVEADDDKE